MTEPWITSPDNITTFPISSDDQPEMKALKLALNAKHIDFDKYAPRFGSNFPNDKRQLKNPSATLNIIKRFCDNCDMECELVFKDKNTGVPNPMNKEIYSDNISVVKIKSKALCFPSQDNYYLQFSEYPYTFSYTNTKKYVCA